MQNKEEEKEAPNNRADHHSGPPPLRPHEKPVPEEGRGRTKENIVSGKSEDLPMAEDVGPVPPAPDLFNFMPNRKTKAHMDLKMICKNRPMRLMHPFRMVVSATTCSVKTMLVSKLSEHRDTMADPQVQDMLYNSGEANSA